MGNSITKERKEELQHAIADVMCDFNVRRMSMKTFYQIAVEELWDEYDEDELDELSDDDIAEVYESLCNN